ncbi:serine-rich adhesin for platelets-like [Haliotis asinina]|uniref:serine-rich adhesin for platelets-like n=1 Tax=Haliotis asinina TaxID=109174 RepID=UPI003532103F
MNLRMKNTLFCLVLPAVLAVGAYGASCDDCWATYNAATKTCTVANAFITCMEDAVNPGCPTSTLNIAAFIGQIASCSLTTLCTCQKDHLLRWSQSTTTLCESEKQKLGCIGGVTDVACDASTRGHTIASSTDTDITNIAGCAGGLTATCQCEKTYATTDISATAGRCTAKKTFVNCLKDKTAAPCKSGKTVISLATDVGTTIGTDCTSFTTSACSCELDYAKADVSSQANRCTAQLNLVSCLKGKTGAGCTGGTTHALATTAFDTDIPAIVTSGTTCDKTDTCTCEATYAKTDISTDHCSAMKTYVNCLKDKTAAACKSGETVITLATAIETPIGTACTSFSTSACFCELGYAKSDISTPANKCTALLNLVSCLKGKTGAGCTASTASTLATTAVDTDIAAIVSGGAPCDLTNTCTCEANYAKADISTDQRHCTALGTFVECLKTKTPTGCEGTAVTALGATAETNYATLTSTCAITDKTCGCEVAYVKMPYASATEKCNAEMTLVSCLKGKAATDLSCDGSSTPIDLATAAGNKFGTCTPTDTCTACELVYAKAAIDTDTKKCAALATYLVCLRSKTAAGCVSSDTVSTLAGQAETDFKATPNPGCSVTDTCQCEIDYIKATRTQNADKCTASKTLVKCLEDKTDLSCDGSTKPSDLATIAETTMTGITNCITDTCQCEVDYVKADHTVGGNICGAKADFLDCMSQSFAAGCDGTKRHTIATALHFTGCPARTGVCSCQETYAKVDNTDATAHCTAIKAHLACLDTEVATTACKSSTTVQVLAALMETQRGTTPGCAALTSTCQCQVNYLKHTRANPTEVCTAHKVLLDCLMTAKDNACDGSVPRNTIVTLRKTPPASCTLNPTCTSCMIPFGEDPYTVPVDYCGSLKTLMQCLDGKAIFTDRGCDETKTISQLVNSFSSDLLSCTLSATCTCQIDYMKSPGATPADKCTALTTKMHCLDKTAETACDGTTRRDQIASPVDTAIVDTGTIPLSATCRTDVTATCDCQTTYAKSNPSGDCAALYAKIECIAGGKTLACLSSVKPVAVATETVSDITTLGAPCTGTETDTCTCQKVLAQTDILLGNAQHCAALVAALLCLKGKTNTGCNTATVESLDIQLKKDIDTIGTTDCPQSDTCACEVTYAKSTLTTLQDKCTAWLAELACLRTATAVGCDGSSTKAEIDTAIKTNMNAATTAGGATNDKCTTNPVCLCEIAYAVATKTSPSDQCTALKTFIGCLAGQTVSGCDGVTKPWTLAADAKTALDNIGTTTCPLTTTCLCEIDLATTTIDDDTKKCNALKTNLDCIIKSSTTSCRGTDRHTYAGTIKSAMDGTTGCPTTYASAGICKDCVIPFAATASTCTTLDTYYHCLYTTSDTTGCGGSKNIKTLADDQATHDTTLTCVSPRRDVCACQVAFLKSTAALCDSLKVLMNCLWAGTANACDNTAKRDAIAATADGKIDTACRGTLSDVCKCQIAYAKADTGTGHCDALIAQFACLEGKTGTGCETSRTLKQVAEGGNTKFGNLSCSTTDTCLCQKAYLIADVSGSNKCPETEKKIACLYATSSVSCDSSVQRTTIMANTDNTCSKTQTCACQRAYGILGGDECTARKGVVTCLRTTTDTGCTGEAAFTKTRSQIGSDLETVLQASPCITGLTDTCQCQIDYAKATVNPAASKCTALKTLILCLADKTALACDGTTLPSALAIAAHDDIKLDSSCVVTTTCECEIAYAKTNVSSNKCDAQRTKMECLYNAETIGCDGTSTRNTLVDGFKADLVSGPCAATTSDVCKTCMINYAAVDPAGAKCSALKTFLGCLDTKAASLTSCDGSQTIIQLATVADQAITTDTSCNAMDTCSCTIVYLKTARADDNAECNALKTKMDCIVKATAAACDGTDRHTYAATVESAMDGVTGCPATYPVGSICKDCEIPMAKASPTCAVLETYYHCLYTTSGTTSCDGSKNIKTLVDDQASQDTSLSCVSPRRDVCACQVAFLKSTATLCDALKVLMNCLWAGAANACDNIVKRDAIATAADAKIDTACRGTLSDVCKCQIAYAEADTGTGHCDALIAQFACLEGKTGTGCETSRTLKQVAEGGNTKFETLSCSTTDTCLCQKAYLIADVSGANKCPETEKKIACLYATSSVSCDSSVQRTTIMANTDNTCSKTQTCACQRAYGILGGDECTARKGVVTCLRTTTDTGCTGEAAFTKTRSQIGSDLETVLRAPPCITGLTDTCQCQIDYAKATVNPAASKCTALGELILCLSGKTALGCDGSTKASALAATAHSDMQTDGCTITDTCLCQITNAKIDVTDGTRKCPGFFDQMDCVFRSAGKGCDGTTERKKVAEDLVAAISTASCTTTSDVCSSCIYTYAQADVEVPATRCSGLGAFLYCLDGKTTTSCKSTSPDSIAVLATYAKTEITKAGSTCSALTDTCECQYIFLTTANSATTCSEHAKRMECIVAATGVACDETVTRSTYATNIAEPNLKAVASCESSLTNTCTLCQFAYAKETSATQTNRCDALKNYYHCLDSKTAVSCFGSKSVTTLATEANTRAVKDSCSLGNTCQCQANFLMADKSDTAKTCTANKDKLSCLAVSFDNACDGSSTRDSVAVSTFAALPSATCGTLNAICTCEKNYTVEPFADEAVHCTNLKTAADCLEGLSGAGCGTNATANTFATAVLAKITSISSCTLSDTCTCQIGFIASDVSTPALKCAALEKEAGCVYEASDVSCDPTVSRTATLTSVGSAITADSCTVPGTCTCQIAYGTSTAADCTKKFTLIGCLQTTEDDGCRGHTTVQTRTALATMVENAAACTKTAACTCQINYAKADVTGANKCLEQKKLAVCLGATETDGCNGGTSLSLAVTAVGVINGIAGCAPAAQTTCKCELDYAVANKTTSDGKCSAAKNLIHCLTFTTDAGCAQTRAAVASTAQTAIADLESASAGSCPLTSSCTCQQTFVTATSFSNDAEKCLEYKKLAVCLGNNNDVACDGSTSKNALVTSVEAKAKEIASCATGLSSSTCQCEINYAKTDTSDNAKKCTAYNKMLTCMFSSTGASCVGTAKTTFVTTIDTNVKSTSLNCTAQTAECTCAVAYAKVDFASATNAAKCSAAQDLLGCMSGKTGTGCDGVQTSTTLLSTAENTITLAVAAGTNCTLTDSCKCEVLFGKADSTNDAAYCSAGLNYFACLSVATDVGCSGTTNDALKKEALAKVITIKGCALPDTCQCQQTFTTSVAANASQECRYALNALSCLSATTSESCDKTQTQSQVASDFKAKVANLSSSSCYQTETCKCQIAYATADTTSSSTKCSAGKTYRTCLDKIQNDQDVGCDDVTQKQYLMQGHVSLVLQACRGCSISHPSVAIILILAASTLLWKH